MDESVFCSLVKSHIDSFTKESIDLQFPSHANYPNINAITDTLDDFGINNVATNIPKDVLTQLPNVFLALIKKDGTTVLVSVRQSKKNYGSGNSILFKESHILRTRRDLANQNNIRDTPKTLIGNQKFPRTYYEYEDLLFFVDTLKVKSNLEIG